MIDLALRHVGVYRRQQSGTQTLDCHSISFHVSGLKRISMLGRTIENPPPYFAFCPEGTRVDFESDAKRENYTALFESAQVRRAVGNSGPEVCVDQEWISMPSLIELSHELIPIWRIDWETMCRLMREPTSSNLLRIKLGLMAVLSYMVSQPLKEKALTPAARLKEFLDNSDMQEKSLKEISEHCGYSTDYLRATFREYYGISPLTYRNRKRMTEAMRLVASTRMTVKEISVKVGFTHTSHFSAMFKRTHGISARDAIARFRYC